LYLTGQIVVYKERILGVFLQVGETLLLIEFSRIAEDILMFRGHFIGIRYYMV